MLHRRDTGGTAPGRRARLVVGGPTRESGHTPWHTLGRTDVPLQRERPLRASRRPGVPSSEAPERDIKPAPRPPNSFPRRIAHRETGEYNARMVESSEPVVTRWDRSPPDREQRAVGTWDVTPTPHGVSVTNADRVPVPEDIEAQLRKEAEQTGDVARTTASVRYDHDLDSVETMARGPRPSIDQQVAALTARSHSANGELDQRWNKAIDLMMKAQERRPRPNRRSSRRAEVKEKEFTVPQIVVKVRDVPARRMGGL